MDGPGPGGWVEGPGHAAAAAKQRPAFEVPSEAGDAVLEALAESKTNVFRLLVWRALVHETFAVFKAFPPPIKP